MSLFVPTTAQYFDTKIYTRLQQASYMFRHFAAIIRVYSTKNWDKQFRIILLHGTRIILNSWIRNFKMSHISFCIYTHVPLVLLISMKCGWKFQNERQISLKIVGYQLTVSYVLKMEVKFCLEKLNLPTYIVDPRILRRWFNNFSQYAYILRGWWHCWLGMTRNLWSLFPKILVQACPW